MKLPDQMRTELKDLWGYYPGRQKASFLWLFLVPILYIAYWTMGFRRLSSGDVGTPYPLYVLAGQTLCWVVEVGIIVLILRINRSTRASWRDSLTTMWSSTFYAFAIVAPAILVVWSLLVCHGSMSFLGIAQILCGLVLFGGSFMLLASLACALAHRVGFMVPLLLLITFHALPIVFGVVYSMHAVPEGWQKVLDFAVPTGPAIRIFRDGLCGLQVGPVSRWLASILHAAAGYWLGVRLWQAVQTKEIGK